MTPLRGTKTSAKFPSFLFASHDFQEERNNRKITRKHNNNNDREQPRDLAEYAAAVAMNARS